MEEQLPTGLRRGRRSRPPWRRTRDRCFRIRICVPKGRSSGPAGSARHTPRPRPRRRAPWRSAARSSGRSRRAEDHRGPPECAVRSRPYIWARRPAPRSHQDRHADARQTGLATCWPCRSCSQPLVRWRASPAIRAISTTRARRTSQARKLGSLLIGQNDRGRFRNAAHASLNHDSRSTDSGY